MPLVFHSFLRYQYYCWTYQGVNRLCRWLAIKKQYDKCPFVTSTSTLPTYPTTSTSTENYIIQLTRLDIASLQQSVKQYYTNGSAQRMWNNYSIGQRCYLTFAQIDKDRPHLLPSVLQCCLLSYLANSCFKHSTIKAYLSPVCHLHIVYGKHTKFTFQLTLRLCTTGVEKQQKLQAVIVEPRVHQPITLEIMQGIKSVLLHEPRQNRQRRLLSKSNPAIIGYTCKPSKTAFHEWQW